MSSEYILSKPQPPPDQKVTYGTDRNQFVEIRLPAAKGPHPGLINIHGGYWRAQYDLTHAGHLCQALRAAGVATFNIEYRRAHSEGGGWPGTFEDIRAAYRFIRQEHGRFNLDLDRLAIMGHSAGGQLALCLAGHEVSVRRVISLAGVVDLKKGFALHLGSGAVADFLGGTPQAVPEHYREADPMELSIPQARQWLLHGKDDDVVPVELSHDYVRAKTDAKSAPAGKAESAELVEIPKAGHFELIDPASEAFKQVTATVMTALG